MITIEGLSPRQVLFADIIWKLNGRDQVDAFIASLPQPERREAQVVVNMMIAAVFDGLSETHMAQELLNQFRK